MPLLFTLLLCCAAADAETKPDVLVVCPPEFGQALTPWIEHRQQQGHEIAVVSNVGSNAEIRAAIREAAQRGGLRHVLLIGDAEPAAATDPQIRARCIPAHLHPAKVNIHWGSEPEIATDNWYADLDDDGVPDLAIGRLPVDSPAELTTAIEKIRRYESAANHGPWRRQVNCVAGVGGFGTLADSILETATKKFLTDGIPAAYHTSMTYGSWQSPYCPDPRLFRDVTLARLNEGCLFWVYIGHGNRHVLDRVRTPAGTFPILDVRDAAQAQSTQGLPIALFLACYTGAFDHPRDCLGEELLRSERGPIAVLCGSRVTMPYAMAVMSNALMDECFHQRRTTLGEVFLHAKRRLVIEDPEDENRVLLDAMAKAISPKPELMLEERREHLSLFNLLGDPLLRLHHPHAIEIEAADSIAAGLPLSVSLTSPIAGRGTVELVCRRDRLKAAQPMRQEFQPTDAFLNTFDAAYRQANDLIWLTQPVELSTEPAKLQLTIPAECRGHCHVRVFLQGEQTTALGAADVYVRRAAQ